MAIISFDREALIDYVPAYGDNRDSEDPCVVRLKFVPFSRIQHYSRLIAARSNGASDPIKTAEIGREVQKRQFVENVVEVENYFVGDRMVKDAGEFYETADTELVIEVIRAMESHSKLTEGQRKN